MDASLLASCAISTTVIGTYLMMHEGSIFGKYFHGVIHRSVWLMSQGDFRRNPMLYEV